MGDLPSPASPLVVHMQTRAVPAAHRELHQLIQKTAAAFASRGVDYATYTTIIGDPNTTHRFAGMSDLQGIGGQDVLHEVLEEAHGADYLPQHFDQYRSIVRDERFEILRFESELSHPSDNGEDSEFLLLMTSSVRPGAIRQATELIARTSKAFQSHHATANYATATTIVGDPNTIYRFAPIASLDHIGGHGDLLDVLGEEHDQQQIDSHFQAYRDVVLEESFSLLRKV
jgi:hypothetical protein